MSTEIEISVKTSNHDTPKDGYASYDMEIEVGDDYFSISGWNRCGYLEAGTYEGLDGLGLERINQHTVWTSCQGDGYETGLPYARVIPSDDGYDVQVEVEEDYQVVYSFEPDQKEDANTLAERLNNAIQDAWEGTPEPNRD